MEVNSFYETDYQLWLEKTLTQLKSGDFVHLDWEHIIEEIEDLGNNNKSLIPGSPPFTLEQVLDEDWWP